MTGDASIWSSSRYGSENDQALDDGDGPGTRTVHQQDYDRLVFSTPVRRLANKTQVWPMDANDGVRSRLTHSHEVANLARSIGARITAVVRKHDENLEAERAIQPILLAAGLSHDLGNPPFGHQGEVAIGNWFAHKSNWIFTHEREGGAPLPGGSEVPERLWPEFTKFDGNPQTLRLLVTLQSHVKRHGLDLSAGTLAASLKYSRSVSGPVKGAQGKKFGYFESELPTVEWIRRSTGLKEGERHPLTWVMEACDDIAYSVLDVEDLLKKGLLSPEDVLTILRGAEGLEGNDTVGKITADFEKVDGTGRRAEIRRDVKVQYIRARTIAALIDVAVGAFERYAEGIMNRTHEVALMDRDPLCDALKSVARGYGFVHPTVLRAEAQGAAAMESVMTEMWAAIVDREKLDDFWSKRIGAKSRYVFSLISPNYVEAAAEAKSDAGPAGAIRYRELRLLTDMMSGMTDGFLTKLAGDLKEMPHVARA